MFKDWQQVALLVLALLCITGTVLNTLAFYEIRETRQRVAERQQYIAESANLQKFSNNFIRALANLSAETGDETIKKLLADNGVTFSVNAPVEPDSEERDD